MTEHEKTGEAVGPRLDRGVGRPEPERDPCCERCGAPITTSAMALICPHGRACEFVVDEAHWIDVESLREELGIKRYPPAFDAQSECQPTLTQCPRCNNPHHACDGGKRPNVPLSGPHRLHGEAEA